MIIRDQLYSTALHAKYPQEFTELCQLVQQRAERGFFNAQQIYAKGDYNDSMVRDFHVHFVHLGMGFQHGWVSDFHFIDIWWG